MTKPAGSFQVEILYELLFKAIHIALAMTGEIGKFLGAPHTCLF